jgi:hypothetical protein
MVEIVNAVSSGVRRPIQLFHLPLPKPHTDDAYFAPLAGLKLRLETELYSISFTATTWPATSLASLPLGAISGWDGVATECGMARGDPARFPALFCSARADRRSGWCRYNAKRRIR